MSRKSEYPLIDQTIAVLQILTLGYAVCGDENVDLILLVHRADFPAVLGHGRKVSQDVVVFILAESRPVFHGAASDQRNVNVVIALRCSILSNRWEDFWEHRAAA